MLLITSILTHEDLPEAIWPRWVVMSVAPLRGDSGLPPISGGPEKTEARGSAVACVPKHEVCKGNAAEARPLGQSPRQSQA